MVAPLFRGGSGEGGVNPRLLSLEPLRTSSSSTSLPDVSPAMLRSPGLRRRRKTSKEERVCTICSQGFKKAEHLARHFRSHTKEKPFHCSTCGKAYARQDTLLRHSRSHRLRDKVWKESEVRESITLEPHAEPSPPESECAPPPPEVDLSLASLNSTSMDATSPEMSVNTNSSIYNSEDTLTTTLLSEDVAGDPRCQPNLWPSSWDPPLDTEWTWWLAGSDFDLESVNLSLMHAFESAPEPVPMALELQPNNVEASSALEKTRLQRKWHTFTDTLTSGQITPSAVQERSHGDTEYRQELAETLRPRVQTGILPSTTFLDLCIQAYFTQFHPIFPVIHAPSFRPCTQNSVLLLSICSLGSLFLGSPRAMNHGISMFERLNKAILASWDTYIVTGGSFGITGLQASLIGQTFGLLVGRPRDLAGIEVFHGSVIAWARKSRLFQLDGETYPDVGELEGEALNAAWQKWIDLEEKKLILMGLHVHDAELAKLHHHEPILRHSIERLPQPAADEVFAATNALSWKRLIMKHRDASISLALVRQANGTSGPILNRFQLCTILESIRALALEHREDVRAWPGTVQKCKDLLVEWYKTYSSIILSRKYDPCCLMILWHATFMDLYADFDALESACGRDGEKVARKAEAYAKSWAQSADAKRCLLHSLLIQRHFETMQVGSDPAIHVPMALYFCGIAWTCYSRFGGRSEPDNLEFPELQLLNVNSNKVFWDATRGLQWGRPESRPMFKMIDCLQRINHWKVAQSFATTLLALVEETQDLF